MNFAACTFFVPHDVTCGTRSTVPKHRDIQSRTTTIPLVLPVNLTHLLLQLSCFETIFVLRLYCSGKKTFYQRSKRRGVLPPSGTAPSASSDTAASGSGSPHPISSSSSPPLSSSAAGGTQTVPKEEGYHGSHEGGHAQPTESSHKVSSSSNTGKSSSAGDAPKSSAATAAGVTAMSDAGKGKDGASAAMSVPDHPECLLIFHSVEAALGGGDAVVASVR